MCPMSRVLCPWFSGMLRDIQSNFSKVYLGFISFTGLSPRAFHAVPVIDAQVATRPSISLIGAAQFGAVALNREFRESKISYPSLNTLPKIFMF